MIKFKIVTPDGITYEDDAVEQVTIPTATGYITVLPGHIPLITPLMAGELVVKKKDHSVPLAVSGGVVEVRPKSEVYILADTAERAEHIDLERAETAKKRAEELLTAAEHEADIDYAKLQAVIERELARINVGKKYRK
mgnify:CR=1 FL=1